MYEHEMLYVHNDLDRAAALQGATAMAGFHRVWDVIKDDMTPYALFSKGRVQFLLQKDVLAIDLLNQAIKGNSRLHQAMSLKGTLLMYMGQPGQTLEVMRQAKRAAEESNPDSKGFAKCVQNQ